MKIFITLLFIFLVPISSFAISESEEDRYVYLFHLYYDNGQLVADRDAEFKYDIVAEIFVPETLNTQFPYKGEVVNLKGEVAETFQFDPKQGNPSFLKGTLSVRAPYLPDGQKVVFYNNQGDASLTIFVSDSSFCNDDGVCNADVGEDSKTCPNDCKNVTPVPTVSPVLPGSGGKAGLVWGAIYVIVGISLAGGLWYFFKKRKDPS